MSKWYLNTYMISANICNSTMYFTIFNTINCTFPFDPINKRISSPAELRIFDSHRSFSLILNLQFESPEECMMRKRSIRYSGVVQFTRRFLGSCWTVIHGCVISYQRCFINIHTVCSSRSIYFYSVIVLILHCCRFYDSYGYL